MTTNMPQISGQILYKNYLHSYNELLAKFTIFPIDSRSIPWMPVLQEKLPQTQ